MIMKYNRFILAFAACGLLLTGCVDEVMEWQDPDQTITEDDLPLNDAEAIAMYKSIKEYAAEYLPNMKIGLGLGADQYLEDPEYKALADANFQMFTTGNAMKHSSVVKANGELNFETVDAFMAAVPKDVEVYGHNFIWHTQQRQQYLKSLIAPEMKVEAGAGDKCENVVTNGTFDNGTNGWSGMGWGKYSSEIVAPGRDDDYALHFTMNTETSVMYDSQLFWELGSALAEETYYYEFYLKSDCNLEVEFFGQNDAYATIGTMKFTAGSEWTLCSGEFTYAGSPADIVRVGIQFGGTPGAQLWVDDFKFGKKNPDYVGDEPGDDNPGEALPFVDIVGEAGTFESGSIAQNLFGAWGNGDSKVTSAISEKGAGHDSEYCVVLTNDTDAGQWQDWRAQFAYNMTDYLDPEKTYIVQFYAKCDVDGVLHFSTQNGKTYSSQIDGTRFNLTSDWTLCEYEFQTVKGDEKFEDVNRLLFSFGSIAGTYFIDDIKFGEKIVLSPSAVKAGRPVTAAPNITYIYKTPEEKKEALLGAMESWISQMAGHLPTVKYWDVINEPIADGSHEWRGINNVFNGTDTAPVENNGLTLNWESDHWYWGYYLGKEYAVKAFEFARKYCPSGSKLFVNDYGLEGSPKKLEALIGFVKYIDDNGQKVDGIGTQMHVQASITKEQVDAMFKVMAATGKLVRVTELDVAVGTTNPTAEQLLQQAEAYKMIFESYKENVPEAQQSGITIWTLSDNPAEHEYWLNGDAPNLFDAKYQRKLAYKYVCDAIAGKDLSEDFKGSDWKTLIETEEDPEESEETPEE